MALLVKYSIDASHLSGLPEWRAFQLLGGMVHEFSQEVARRWPHAHLAEVSVVRDGPLLRLAGQGRHDPDQLDANPVFAADWLPDVGTERPELIAALVALEEQLWERRALTDCAE
jgi:hypothetical protein